jgi:hypothetical protein
VAVRRRAVEGISYWRKPTEDGDVVSLLPRSADVEVCGTDIRINVVESNVPDQRCDVDVTDLRESCPEPDRTPVHRDAAQIRTRSTE